MLTENPGRGESKATPGADSRHIVIRFDYVPVPGYHEKVIFIRGNEQRLEMPEILVRSPQFGQLNRRPGKIPVEFL